MRIFYPGEGPADQTFRLDQLEAIARMTREITVGAKGVLCGAGMGSGKTACSVEVIRNTKPKRCLIVGVRDAYSQWAASGVDQGLASPIVKIDKTVAGRANMQRLLDGGNGIFYVGLEMLRAQDWERVSETFTHDAETMKMFGDLVTKTFTKTTSVQKRTFTKMKPLDLLVSDEAHRHTNAKTAGIDTMRSIPTKAKIALSGTFFGNKFENAYALCVWIWDKATIGSKAGFEDRYCVKVPVMSKDGRTQLKSRGGFPLSKILSERNPGEFVETLPCYVFIATPIGPVPKPDLVMVDMSVEQKRQYGEMEHQSLTWIPSSTGRAPLVADLPITQRIRLRTAALGGMTLVHGKTEEDSDSITFEPDCKSSTLSAAHTVLHRPGWVGQKVLILTHSLPFAEEAARRIGQKYNVALKTGNVTSGQWEKDKASFMEPVSETSVQYIVAVISAVGTAMDGLQANCSKILWMSEDENNTNNLQASNRIWRQGVDIATYESVKLIQRGTIAEEIVLRNDAHKVKTMKSVAGTK